MVVVGDTRNVAFAEFPNIHFSSIATHFSASGRRDAEKTNENSDHRGPLFLPANLA